MRTGMLALAAGLALLRLLPGLPPVWMLLLVAAGMGVLLFFDRLRPLGLLGLGFCWACLSAHWALDDTLADELSGRTFWLEGRVTGLPDRRDGVVRFELDSVTSRHPGLPTRLRLAWYDGPPVAAGERWRLAARLKSPHGLVNPASFDYEAWLLARRIGATGTVKAGELLEAAGAIEGLRDGLRTRLMKVEAHGREGALAALVVGDDSGLSSLDWRVLQETGTVHLMVISGQHVSMLAGLIFLVVMAFVRRGLWPQQLPWLPWACALALAGALAYGWLAGFEVPVRRACVMVAIVLLWRLRFRHLGIWLPLLAALDLVLLFEPLASLQPGFWLSFGAVALLALTLAGRLGSWRWWQGLPRAQWATSLGLLPLLLGLGLPVSLTGPLANLLAVPWVGFLVVPLALMGTVLLPIPGLGESLLWLAGLFSAWLFDLLQQIANWQPAWLAPSLSLLEWLLLACGVLMLLLPAGLPLRSLGLVLCLPLFFADRHLPADGNAQVWVLDVGQGLSVLIRTREHALLYDAGPRHGDFDIGERVVAPSLYSLGVDGLDMLLLSHADMDHAGGAEAVARSMPIRAVISGEVERLPPSLHARNCESGARWEWNRVRFTLWRWRDFKNSNQASCVLMVEAKGERLLLTGDIDRPAEAALLASGLDLTSRWLLLAHHGSRSASSAVFLAAVAAEKGLISRGLHNNFGHPHPDVLKRATAAGMQLYDTAQKGALTFELGEFDELHGLRESARFWRRN
ncbi:DNA internalization-related competence protein ComEC/Rec2 [Azomonas macrocytogenes]|uniref:Competence protein ComEC n=1 Tax=Azomonas macrocytogenes TaxID=69962 RepID=A0A839SWX5_AZOMA|nr:DNA internalization-related competence protein ComEC/Rec2 [Azomonas macrocytogenes]MBB3101881.1 competence protein ComEC [Azomonas macrocytogenes]